MRSVRSFVTLSLVSCFAVLGLLAMPLNAEAAPHTARGKGTSGTFELGFAFEAEGSPRKATGRVRFETVSFGTVRGNVTCLKVDGNQATLTGRFIPSAGIEGTGLTHFAVVVQDNGSASSGAVDAAVFVLAGARQDCTEDPGHPLQPVVSGNIRVR